jgi:hypothetical protein
MPRLRRIGRFLLKVVGVLIAVYAFDVVLTRYLLPDALLARIDLERLSRIHSPIYHHGLRPMRVVEVARWGTHNYRFATNSLGFKDGAAREVPLTSQKHRIVIIGDSFTEGSGYAFEDTFAGRIAHALEPKGIEVFNAGVISYSPAIYYRRLKYLIETEGFRFDEVVVFLDISDIQDEVSGVFLDEDDNVIGRGGSAADRWLDSVIEPIRSFMKDSSLLYRFISEANRARKRLWTHANPCLERLGTRADDPRPLGLEFLRQQLVKPRNSWTFDEAVYQEWGREGLEIASANMDRLRAVLEQHGIALTLAVYPWPAQIFEGDLESRQVRFWQDWAAAREVPFLDLFPAFIGETPPLESYARYFIPCDSHFNAAGHALVAEGYLAFH